MQWSKRFLQAALVGTMALGLGATANAQPPRGGRGPGMMHDKEHHADMEVFHFLVDHRQEIRRTVKEIADGVSTLTESDAPEVAATIKAHVAAMYARMKERRPIHVRDPLFAAVFQNADKIAVEIEQTPTGLRVTETSKDPYVAKLIKAHAKVVSAFLENGRAEMMTDHPLPPRD